MNKFIVIINCKRTLTSKVINTDKSLEQVYFEQYNKNKNCIVTIINTDRDSREIFVEKCLNFFNKHIVDIFDENQFYEYNNCLVHQSISQEEIEQFFEKIKFGKFNQKFGAGTLREFYGTTLETKREILSKEFTIDMLHYSWEYTKRFISRKVFVPVRILSIRPHRLRYDIWFKFDEKRFKELM